MTISPAVAGTLERALADLHDVGRLPSGGYGRYAWTDVDRVLRDWFTDQAARRGMDVVADRAGNLWAWWGDPDRDGPGVVTGSHLDSVPGGGAFDGPLGVISGFCAVDGLREHGLVPSVPLGVVCFGDEEGARFGVACAGSRVVTGALPADRALALRDVDGTTMGEALARAGQDVERFGADPEAMRRVRSFVELHIEQGRMLPVAPDGGGAAVGVGSGIWPHGRWRIDLPGQANHAGTTPLDERRDPMLELADLVLRARASASAHGALATVGKVLVEPNGVNAIASQVTAWLDARAAEEGPVRAVLGDLERFGPREESWTAATVFDAGLVDRCVGLLDEGTPVVVSGAGHDAGILAAAGVPTAMLVVRNPTGISHSPEEHADPADCLAGVDALTAVLADLTGARR